MLIGICFGDNDFNATVRVFLLTFNDSVLVLLNNHLVSTSSGYGRCSLLDYLEEECLEKFTKDNNYAFSYVDTDTSKIWCS